MIHIQTGNALDVVFDLEDGVKVLRGLQRRGSDEIIPLPDPLGLIDVLRAVHNECEVSRLQARATTPPAYRGEG